MVPIKEEIYSFRKSVLNRKLNVKDISRYKVFGELSIGEHGNYSNYSTNAGSLVEASRGNILEATNLALNIFDKV